MRNSRMLPLAMLACLCSAGLSFKTAQAQAAGGAAGYPIAVVDVGLIFRTDEGIKQRMSAVENAIKSYEAEFANKRKEAVQALESLKQFNPGSPEYAAAEEKAARMESDLKLEFTRKRKELGESEAKVYFESYQQISAAVQQIAEVNNIHLVLRYNSEEMSVQNEDSVLRGLQKSVIYRRNNLDLTPLVLQMLQRATPAATQAARPGATAPR